MSNLKQDIEKALVNIDKTIDKEFSEFGKQIVGHCSAEFAKINWLTEVYAKHSQDLKQKYGILISYTEHNTDVGGRFSNIVDKVVNPGILGKIQLRVVNKNKAISPDNFLRLKKIAQKKGFDLKSCWAPFMPVTEGYHFKERGKMKVAINTDAWEDNVIEIYHPSEKSFELIEDILLDYYKD